MTLDPNNLSIFQENLKKTLGHKIQTNIVEAKKKKKKKKGKKKKPSNGSSLIGKAQNPYSIQSKMGGKINDIMIRSNSVGRGIGPRGMGMNQSFAS